MLVTLKHFGIIPTVVVMLWANRSTHIGNCFANLLLYMIQIIVMIVYLVQQYLRTILSFLSPVQFLNASSQAENFCITNCGYSSQDVLVLYQDG